MNIIRLSDKDSPIGQYVSEMIILFRVIMLEYGTVEGIVVTSAEKDPSHTSCEAKINGCSFFITLHNQ